MKNAFAFLQKNPKVIVVALWIFFTFLWYLRFGFVFTLEAPKYIGEANYFLKHHHFSQFRYLFYSTLIVVIAFSLSIKIGTVGALLIIMAVNLWAYLFLFSSLQRFFGRVLPALLSIGLLLSFWPYHSWTVFLFTECIFYSFVLFLFGHLLRFNGLNFRFLSITGVLLFLLLLSRPLGILFVPPVLLFIFVHLSKRQRLYMAFAGIGFLVLLNYIVEIFFTTTADWSMAYALTGDMITCDMPVYNSSYHPELSNSPNQLYQLWYYLQHNFPHFLGLAAKRLQYFFFLVKPFHSLGHNLYLIAYDIVIYGSLVWNFNRIRRAVPTAVLLFIFSSILLFALATALQCDEYHSRFALTLTPFWISLTVMGWWPLLQKFLASRLQENGFMKTLE